jgi:hypothetical protein
MNTPPKRKRHQIKVTGGFVGAGIAGAAGAITDDGVASALGKLIGTFTHLENRMARPLAILARTDEASAGYILRSIRNPRAKIDLLSALLEKSPFNQDRSEKWDLIIREYGRVSSARNGYVHGEWWSADDGSTWIAEWEEHGLGPFAARRIEATELDKLRNEIVELLFHVSLITDELTQASA